MDINTWRPHGLITDPGLEIRYLSAQHISVTNNTVINPKQSRTRSLFDFLFNKYIFTGVHFGCSRPAHNSPPCDLIIERFREGSGWRSICLCFSSVTVSKDGGEEGEPFGIEELEARALNGGELFLHENMGADSIHAMTLVGVSLRCWTYRRGEERLRGCWAEGNDGAFGDYLDIGSDENRSTLERVFRDLKSVQI